MNPAQLQQLLKQGLAHHQAGRLKQAESFYRQARTAAPRSADALSLSGMLAYQEGRYADAILHLRTAAQIDPRSPVYRMRLGVALAAAHQHAEAITHLKLVVTATPKDHEAWNSLAFSLRVLGQTTEAIAAYEKAIALKPDYHEAIDRLGALQSDLSGLATGVAYFRRALKIKPDYAPALCNLGLALAFERKFHEPLACFSRALASDPNLATATAGKALVYQQSYCIEEALAAFEATLVRQPNHFEAHTGRLLTLNYLAGRSREEVFAAHLAFGRLFPTPTASKPIAIANRRLRVAFLSPDFRNHSVFFFIEPLLKHLDRTRFEILLYHDHFQVDACSERLKALGSLWRNFVGQSNELVERTIRTDAPDILIDLAGHTGNNRLALLARRLASVQVSYLGYPNTTGIAAMDYRFIDAITDPGDEDQRFHTEKLIRCSPCAWSYQPPENPPEPASPATPHIAFGSFNNFAKASDFTLRLWGRVLNTVPNSRLLLKAHCLNETEIGEIVEKKLRLLGVDRSRIELLGRTPDTQSHLALYNRVDIALDTFPYHGTTTTCEALWMGVPLITLLGDRHAARVSASLLTAIGHPEWIAKTEDDFVNLAVALANNSALRTTARTTLRQSMRESILLDHAGQARRFGEALQLVTGSAQV